jgi:membrane associated rhomboid family serine protease
MALNIFFFLVTVFIANVNLPADRIIGRQKATALLNENLTDPAVQSAVELAKSLDPDLEKNGIAFTAPDNDDSSRTSVFSKKGGKIVAQRLLWRAATNLAYRKAGEKGDTQDGYQRAWQIEYMDSRYVLTPHYSALEVFAYQPGEASVIGKLLGLIGSMFLHGGFEHIMGNMFFLWIFGRAIEDALGPRVYLGAYLLCGIAATLMYHTMTQLFNPAGMMIPSLGASGAIAGVMGLFAPRFYRTPVRVFYLLPTAIFAGAVAFGILFAIGAMMLGDLIAGAVLAAALVLAGLYYLGKTWAWGAFKAPAAWFLGAYVSYFDLYPALKSLFTGGDTGDGVAHWAHIGGFLFGMLYAFMIGSQKEGKQEFMLEDAVKAYDLGDVAGTITYAQNVLEREPNNAQAYELIAKSNLKQNNEDEALDNFELAIQNYLRVGNRDEAAAAYLTAIEKYPTFILPPSTQAAVGNQMAKNSDYKNAAETLVKIPYTFPDAPEGEVALLRAAQLYIERLGEAQTGLQLLQHFWQTFPESQWMPQVERAWRMAEFQLNSAAEAEAEAAAPVIQEAPKPARQRPVAAPIPRPPGQ